MNGRMHNTRATTWNCVARLVARSTQGVCSVQDDLRISD